MSASQAIEDFFDDLATGISASAGALGRRAAGRSRGIATLHAALVKLTHAGAVPAFWPRLYQNLVRGVVHHPERPPAAYPAVDSRATPARAVDGPCPPGRPDWECRRGRGSGRATAGCLEGGGRLDIQRASNRAPPDPGRAERQTGRYVEQASAVHSAPKPIRDWRSTKYPAASCIRRGVRGPAERRVEGIGLEPK
jgi:hypothetical protein